MFFLAAGSTARLGVQVRPDQEVLLGWEVQSGTRGHRARTVDPEDLANRVLLGHLALKGWLGTQVSIAPSKGTCVSTPSVTSRPCRRRRSTRTDGPGGSDRWTGRLAKGRLWAVGLGRSRDQRRVHRPGPHVPAARPGRRLLPGGPPQPMGGTGPGRGLPCSLLPPHPSRRLQRQPKPPVQPS